jgi:cbb3-type cytochrome oxidase subunit 3
METDEHEIMRGYLDFFRDFILLICAYPPARKMQSNRSALLYLEEKGLSS